MYHEYNNIVVSTHMKSED